MLTTTPSGAAAQDAATAKDSGGIGVRLLDAPASAGNDPRARVYIVDHLAPGTVVHRRIEVSNAASSTTGVALYAAAATIVDGRFVGSPGHQQDDLSSWTSVSPTQALVPPSGRLTATVTIAVPTDAAPGEHYGVVWAEARTPPAPGSGVTQVSRVGVRLYLSIGPGGPPASDFTIEALSARRAPDGRPKVVATVRNTGGRALDVTGSLRLSSGPGGVSAGPFEVTSNTTLGIDDVQSVAVPLDRRLPRGPWEAHITLRSGLLERSAHATIAFPAVGSTTVVAIPDRPGWRRLATVVPAVGIGAAGATAALVVHARHRRRSRHRPSHLLSNRERRASAARARPSRQ